MSIQTMRIALLLVLLGSFSACSKRSSPPELIDTAIKHAASKLAIPKQEIRENYSVVKTDYLDGDSVHFDFYWKELFDGDVVDLNVFNKHDISGFTVVINKKTGTPVKFEKDGEREGLGIRAIAPNSR